MPLAALSGNSGTNFPHVDAIQSAGRPATPSVDAIAVIPQTPMRPTTVTSHPERVAQLVRGPGPSPDGPVTDTMVPHNVLVPHDIEPDALLPPLPLAADNTSSGMRPSSVATQGNAITSVATPLMPQLPDSSAARAPPTTSSSQTLWSAAPPLDLTAPTTAMPLPTSVAHTGVGVSALHPTAPPAMPGTIWLGHAPATIPPTPTPREQPATVALGAMPLVTASLTTNAPPAYTAPATQVLTAPLPLYPPPQYQATAPELTQPATPAVGLPHVGGGGAPIAAQPPPYALQQPPAIPMPDLGTAGAPIDAAQAPFALPATPPGAPGVVPHDHPMAVHPPPVLTAVSHPQFTDAVRQRLNTMLAYASQATACYALGQVPPYVHWGNRMHGGHDDEYLCVRNIRCKIWIIGHVQMAGFYKDGYPARRVTVQIRPLIPQDEQKALHMLKAMAHPELGKFFERREVEMLTMT